MKRQDVKTGVVYSYRTGQRAHDKGRRIVVLDVDTFYAGHGGGYGSDKGAPTFTVPKGKTKDGK